MGENVLEYDGVLLDEDDPYYEECSSSEDDFLEIPLNDRFFYKHWKINYTMRKDDSSLLQFWRGNLKKIENAEYLNFGAKIETWPNTCIVD